MVFKKNHYVTFNHCTSLPHIIFCIMFLMYLNILFYYYVLLPLILTIVTCMYYYCILQAMYGPSLINYCLLSICTAQGPRQQYLHLHQNIIHGSYHVHVFVATL